MKASLKFREDQMPLVRAKIPVSILGLPFLSGISAGESRELRLDLSTAFESGPTFRVSYRPNDSWNPFSLVVKSGIGVFGSPIGAPMSMSTDFNLLSRGGGPSFTVLFKPRLGDFCIKKSTRSVSTAAAPPMVNGRKIAVDHDTYEEGPVDGVETPTIGFQPEKTNGFSSAITAGGGIHGLLSGVEVTARTVLPLRNRGAVRFRWGVRVPAELRTDFAEDGSRRASTAGISLSKLPLLVMSKITIEHVAEEQKVKPDTTKFSADVAETCMSVKRQLEALQAENGMLRKAVEDLRTEVVSGGGGGGRWISSAAERQVSDGPDVNKSGTKPAAGKRDRRSEGKPEANGKAKTEDVNEELKKALMDATGAGK